MTEDQQETVLYKCTIDESATDEVHAAAGAILARDYETLGRALIDSREVLTLGLFPIVLKKEFEHVLGFMAYACEHPTRRKRVSMDVEKMVKTWIPLVKQLACAHDIDEKDAASSALDEQLLPVVGAPVAEIRSFYRKLTAELKADKTVPWAVWKLFDFWGENVLEKINKDEVVQLKTAIATRIAENSMEQIPREDWVASMIGALQWRTPEKLQEIEQKIDAGHKPRVKGRESCLFLQVDGAEVML